MRDLAELLLTSRVLEALAKRGRALSQGGQKRQRSNSATVSMEWRPRLVIESLALMRIDPRVVSAILTQLHFMGFCELHKETNRIASHPHIQPSSHPAACAATVSRSEHDLVVAVFPLVHPIERALVHLSRMSCFCLKPSARPYSSLTTARSIRSQDILTSSILSRWVPSRRTNPHMHLLVLPTTHPSLLAMNHSQGLRSVY